MMGTRRPRGGQPCLGRAGAVPTPRTSSAGFYAGPADDAIGRTCGQRASDYLGRQTPRLIILAVHLTGMNDLECLRGFRASAEWRGIPVVMHSADVDPGPMIKAEQLGVRD